MARRQRSVFADGLPFRLGKWIFVRAAHSRIGGSEQESRCRERPIHGGLIPALNVNKVVKGRWLARPVQRPAANKIRGAWLAIGPDAHVFENHSGNGIT